MYIYIYIYKYIYTKIYTKNQDSTKPNLKTKPAGPVLVPRQDFKGQVRPSDGNNTKPKTLTPKPSTIIFQG